ncbi:MAG: DNA adenine methylase [Desulfobulbaceae bacterium]|nr:DNA adenine methylase [Desulfobulbaceae bacterium]
MNVTQQESLFPQMHETTIMQKPVNVASIPQRSPFRYPGGKTWFVPTFRDWMAEKSLKPALLIEPFTGGGIISLTALCENLVHKVVMVELDEDIAAVWQTIVDGKAEWLAHRILNFDLTKENLLQELSEPAEDIQEKAFQTILKNRTFHGGILAGGSGLLKHGENGKGIRSRWYPQTLAKRFLAISQIANKISFRPTDGLNVMNEFANRDDVVFFIDPPYTAGGKKAGKRLYRYSVIDHEKLFELCETLTGDFIMTYDNAEEVKQMARKHGFQMRLIPMTNTHNTTMEELVIGKDLTWMDWTCNRKMDTSRSHSH